MKHDLIGEIVLNKDISQLENEVENYLKKAEMDILKTIKDLDDMNFKSEYEIKGKDLIIVKMNAQKHFIHPSNDPNLNHCLHSSYFLSYQKNAGRVFGEKSTYWDSYT